MPNNTFYETIVKGFIFGSFFGTAYFAVDRLLKLADDQIKLNKKLVSQLKDCEEELSQVKKNFHNVEKPLIEKIIFQLYQHV